MLKKIISFILAVIIFFLIPSLVNCSKPETVKDEYYTYTLLADGTYSVKATNIENVPRVVELPAIFNGRIVSTVEKKGFSGCLTMEELVLSEKMEHIGVEAFRKCSNLSFITMGCPDIGFGNGAFAQCSTLVSIKYSGTMAEWKKILRASNWDYKTGNYGVYCLDGALDKNNEIIVW